MRCPSCQTENDNNAVRCSNCGASLQEARQTAGALKAVTTTGAVFGKKAREARIKEIVDPSLIISDKAYNGVIGALLLWGLLINYILCLKVGPIYKVFPNMNPIVFIIGYLVLVIAGIMMTVKSRSPVLSFIGYNLVVVPFGVIIATAIDAYGGINSEPVTLAFLYTLLIAAAMIATVVVFPQAFEKIGRALGIALIGLIFAEIIMLIFHVRQIWTSWLAAGLFSLYLGYDIYRSQLYPRTVKNAIASALDIYMDLANLFLRILEIIGDSKN